MSDLLQTAAEWLGSMFQLHASRVMVYCRIDVRMDILGTFDKPADIRDETTQGGTITTDHTDRDIVFPAAAIASLGLYAEPIEGDTIEVPLADGRWDVYQVLPPPGQKAWKRCDVDGIYLKVHTKKINTIVGG